MIIPLGQNCLIERDAAKSEAVMRKSGILKQANDQLRAEGLVTGVVLVAPKDQQMILDKTRPVNDVEVRVGDRVWYSEFSVGHIEDDRDGHQGDLLDMVPLEDLRAIVN